MLNIEIKPDELQAAVVKAVVEAGLGKAIKEAVESCLKPSSYGNKNVVQNAVEAVVLGVTRKLVEEELAKPAHQAPIREIVLKKDADGLDLVERTVSVVGNKIAAEMQKIEFKAENRGY